MHVSAAAIICAIAMSKLSNSKLRIFLFSIILINGIYIGTFKVLPDDLSIKNYADSHTFRAKDNVFSRSLCMMDIKCLKPEKTFVHLTLTGTSEANVINYLTAVRKKVRPVHTIRDIIKNDTLPRNIIVAKWDDDYYNADLEIYFNDVQMASHKEILLYNFHEHQNLSDLCKLLRNNTDAILLYYGKSLDDAFDDVSLNTTSNVKYEELFYSHIYGLFNTKLFRLHCTGQGA